MFSFKVTVTNSSDSEAIRLEDVRYHFKIEDATVAVLTVPAVNPDKDGISYKVVDPASGDFVDLPPNAEVQEMSLFPRPTIRGGGPVVIEQAGDLDVGDTDGLTLYGRTGTDAGGRSTRISCRITSEPDVDIPITTELLEVVEG